MWLAHAGVSAVAFPALVVQSGVTSGQVTLALCARVLLVALALTAVVKVVTEDSSAAWCCSSRRGISVLGKSPGRDFPQRLIGGVLAQKPTLRSLCFHSCTLPSRPLRQVSSGQTHPSSLLLHGQHSG